jgi:hypothetical protein
MVFHSEHYSFSVKPSFINILIANVSYITSIMINTKIKNQEKEDVTH